MTKARSAIECGNVKRPDNSGIYTRHAVPGAPPASVASGRLLIPRPSVCCASFLGAHEESVKIKEWKGKKKKKTTTAMYAVSLTMIRKHSIDFDGKEVNSLMGNRKPIVILPQNQ